MNEFKEGVIENYHEPFYAKEEVSREFDVISETKNVCPSIETKINRLHTNCR